MTSAALTGAAAGVVLPAAVLRRQCRNAPGDARRPASLQTLVLLMQLAAALDAALSLKELRKPGSLLHHPEQLPCLFQRHAHVLPAPTHVVRPLVHRRLMQALWGAAARHQNRA